MTPVVYTVKVNPQSIARILSLIEAYGWNVYKFKTSYFVSDKPYNSMKELTEGSYVGFRVLTMEVTDILVKTSENKVKTRNYGVTAMIDNTRVEILTLTDSLVFRNLTESNETFDSVKVKEMWDEGRLSCKN